MNAIDMESRIGRLHVTTGRPGAVLDGAVTIVAEDLVGGSPWAVALMELPPVGGLDLHYAQRLVRCFEACRGVPDEVLEAGIVAGLMALLIDKSTHGGWYVDELPTGSYVGGEVWVGEPSRVYFADRADAERVVLAVARERAKEAAQ